MTDDLRHKFLRGLGESAVENSLRTCQRPAFDQLVRSIVLLSIYQPLEAITSYRSARDAVTGIGQAPTFPFALLLLLLRPALCVGLTASS